MLSKKIEAALNKQINHELNNSLTYKAVAVWFRDRYFDGFAKWFEVVAKDEEMHAQKFIGYLQARQGAVAIAALPGPKFDGSNAATVCKDVLALEQATTALIHELHKTAQKEDDLATQSMLKWFIDEQVEEEEWATELSEMMTMLEGKSVGGMFALDHRWSHKAEGK